MKNILKNAGFLPLKNSDRPLYQKYFRGPLLDLCFCALSAYWEEIYYKEYQSCLCLILKEEGRFFALPPMERILPEGAPRFNADKDCFAPPAAGAYSSSRENSSPGASPSIQSENAGGKYKSAPQKNSLGQKHAAVEFICSLFSRARIKPRFEYIPLSQLELFKSFSVGFDPRFSDCVLPQEQLLRLSWKFKHKTADYNYFVRTVPGAEIHPFNSQNAPLFEEALNNWCAGRDCAQCLFGCEKEILKKYISGYPSNGACGITVTDRGRPIGCIIGEASNNCLYYCFGKSDKRYNGLSVYMYIEFARRFPAEWVNLGSDGGLEGLRRFKDKFAPYQRLDKYWAEL